MNFKTMCQGCQKQYMLTEKNTLVHAYVYMAWMSWMESFCPHCGYHNEQWLCGDQPFGPTDQHVYFLEGFTNQSTIPFINAEVPEDELIFQFNRQHRIELPAEHELAQSEEAEVGFFHWLIDHGVTE